MVIKMSIKKLGIVLFLLIAVIGFSCSSVNAKYENDLHMDVSVGGGTGDCLKGYSSKKIDFHPGSDEEYDHCPGKKERGWTWLAMNNDIKTIVVEAYYEKKFMPYRFSRITWDKWGNNVDNIDYLWVESKYDDYPRAKLYLKNGKIIDIDEWEHLDN
jgi:hypothetical protein